MGDVRDEARATVTPAVWGDPWFRRTMGLVLVVKAVLFLVSWLSLQSMGSEPHPFASDGTILFAWDSFHYARILDSGYPDPDGRLMVIGFFPGLPLLAYPLAQLISTSVAILIVSNLLSTIGYAFVFLWARDLYGSRMAFLASLVTLAYPPAFFASAAYSEAPFLFFTGLVLFLLGRQRFLPAAVIAGIGSFFRPTGAVLGLLVLVELWRQGAVSWKRAKGHAVAMTLAVALIGQTGALAYEGYLTARYDDWLIYVRGQDQWTTIDDRRSASDRAAIEEGGAAADEIREQRARRRGAQRSAGFVGRMKHRLGSLGAWNKLLAGMLVLVIAAGALRPGKIPRTLFLLPAIVLLLGYVPGMGARITCLPRFGLISLPCFLWLAVRLDGRKLVFGALLVAMFAHQLILAYAFTRGGWTG